MWDALAHPDAFPDDPSAAAGVEWVQTHLSHVYLTGARVYKFRKPVDLGFVDFTTRENRNADCLREVALNRRLAPDVYLGVAPLADAGAARVGPPAEALAGDAEAIEHCVVMRRLSAGRDALSLLQTGRLSGQMLDTFAGKIARFHAEHGLGRPAPFSADAWRERCTRPVEENFRILAEDPSDLVPRDLLAEARDRAAGFAAGHADRFERRRREGRAVDGHGDLHLQHVWYESDTAEPLAIDCLEFSDVLRQIDTASEVAFLAMDLRYRGERGLAERFLRTYARETDDFDLYSVVDYFLAYRAGVRAKVAALASRDEAIAPGQRTAAEESTVRHLRLAAEALDLPAKPALVLVGGIVGTGKSTVAAELAERLDAVVIASDRVRKRMLGVASTTRMAEGWNDGAYSPQQTERTYAGLLERARPVLASGRPAILDATFSRRAHRAAAARLADDLGCATFAVRACCAPDVARARLAHRAQAGTDPSDAGPEAYAPSARGFESLDEWPEGRRAEVHTDREGWQRGLAELAERIEAAAG